MDQVEVDKLFQTAIRREVEAFNFYTEVAQRVENPSVKELFKNLAGQEKDHEELLWKAKGDPQTIMKIKPPKDFKVAENLHDLPELSVDMKPADALALAMKKEQQAADFYRMMASIATDDQARDMYENLVNMELKHKAAIEDAFVDVGYPEAW